MSGKPEMNKAKIILTCLTIMAISIQSCSTSNKEKFQTPVSFEKADGEAEQILKKLTTDQKIELLGGHAAFFHGSPENNIPYIFMADATQGVRLLESLRDTTIVKRIEKTTSFPAPVLLASTWNPELAGEYARCVGEEARAAGVSILLGPGLNIYRHAQAGRSFEYFGEDPFLVSRIIEKYIIGVQNTGTAATLKHFVCNNTDFYRRRSNSIVDERTLNEIYLPGFKAGVDAGAMAVMTAYNKLDGEWCGQSEYVINDILRTQLGFKWLVMTDWESVYDGEKVIKSGQDLEMPGLDALVNTKELFEEGKITEQQIDRMLKSILRMCIAMDFYNRPQQDLSYLKKYEEHEQIALQTSREGIVLLKNENNILPIQSNENIKIVAVGKYLDEIAFGGGAAHVEGYNNVKLSAALKNEFGDKVEFVEFKNEKKISDADVVLISTGTFDNEGWDRPFDFPEEELNDILKTLELNKNSVLIVNSGAGVNMSPFVDKTKAVIYAWYPGQTGNTALAEILSGKTNPSGKLPITVEKQFKDSPGYGYMPENEELYSGWAEDKFTHKEYDITYDEGVFVGYRWYEHKKIIPLFAFGHGLSYSEFEYKDLKVEPEIFSDNNEVVISFLIKNTSSIDGTEIGQVYVQDIECTFPRPLKELKGFEKISLKAGEEKAIVIKLDSKSFSYWNPEKKQWYAEPGEFKILVGSSSDNILLEQIVELKK